MSKVDDEQVRRAIAQIRAKGEVQPEDRFRLIEAGLTPAEADALLEREGLK